MRRIEQLAAGMALQIRKFVAAVGSWGAEVLALLRQNARALTLLDRRTMEGSLAGADMSLMLVEALEKWEPVGPPWTARPL